MAAHVNIAGFAVMSLALSIPYYGLWTADVTLAQAQFIPSNATLSIGAMSLVGTVVRAAQFGGSRSARLVGGYGGWRNSVVARAYQSPVGVKLSHVIGDAAAEVGEKVSVASDRSLGVNFIREATVASQLLRQLSNGLWWMDFTGTTQVGTTRASGAIASAFQVITSSGGKGHYTIATETPADWVPGATFTAPTVPTTKTIASVSHHIDNEGVARIEVLTTEAGETA